MEFSIEEAQRARARKQKFQSLMGVMQLIFFAYLYLNSMANELNFYKQAK